MTFGETYLQSWSTRCELLSSCIALGEARRIAEASRIEERMRLINPRVDVSNLNSRAGNGSATGSIPGIRRIDDLVALAQDGMIKDVCTRPAPPSAPRRSSLVASR